MKQALKQRFGVILKSLDITPAAFAKKAGFERQIMNRITSGATSPSFETLVAIAKAFPTINVKYILVGELPVFNGDEKANIEADRYKDKCPDCLEKQKMIEDLRKFNNLLSESLDECRHQLGHGMAKHKDVG